MKTSFKNRSLMALFIIFALVSVVIINVLSFNHNKKFDLTSEGAFSLSDQTLKILDGLKDNISIYAFVAPDRKQAATDLLEQYEYKSEKVTISVADPDVRPVLAKKFKITDYETYVVETGSGRREIVKILSESQITNAIIKATTTDEKIVYILEGHSERSSKDDNPRGWSGAAKALEGAAYNVKPLNWFTTGMIPEDADLLIIAGPKDDFQPEEIKRLDEKLDNGLSLMVALDPEILPNLENFLGEFGFNFHEDIIVDPLSQQLGFEWLLATVPVYGKHEIVEGAKTASFFWVARSIDVRLDNKRKTDISIIGSTVPQSWSEMAIESIGQGTPAFASGEDMAGPRTILASAQWEIGPAKDERKIGEDAKKSRMVVVGDSDFAANAYLGLSGNKDLFLNIASWLLEQENRISIRPKTRGFNPIIFSASQLTVMFWIIVVALPGSVTLAGVIVWIRRKRA